MAKSKNKAVEEVTAQWKRALADYQNLEKRTAAERLQYYKLATTTLVTRLLPILDDLARARVHLNDPGLEIIEKQLTGILKDEGLAEIEVLNSEFDPTTMECVEQVAGEKNKVMRVDLKGYRLHELVIRPAKVAVGV